MRHKYHRKSLEKEFWKNIELSLFSGHICVRAIWPCNPEKHHLVKVPKRATNKSVLRPLSFTKLRCNAPMDRQYPSHLLKGILQVGRALYFEFWRPLGWNCLIFDQYHQYVHNAPTFIREIGHIALQRLCMHARTIFMQRRCGFRYFLSHFRSTHQV